MNPEVADLKAECDALAGVLRGLGDEVFLAATGFKDWTVEQILCHLISGNRGAVLSLQDPEGFQQMFKDRRARRDSGVPNAEIEREQVGDVHGQALVDSWLESVDEIVAAFGEIDLSQRVPWAKAMSARSSVSARMMENWAHGQAIYDLLGIDRQESDRIRNIVILGVNTYGWTFENQGKETPGPRPLVELVAPSGESWTFPAKDGASGKVAGSAVEFCQVVTQVRNIADTQLVVEGESAKAWMDAAQCFAGPPHAPPAPGTRRKQVAPA